MDRKIEYAELYYIPVRHSEADDVDYLDMLAIDAHGDQALLTARMIDQELTEAGEPSDPVVGLAAVRLEIVQYIPRRD